MAGKVYIVHCIDTEGPLYELPTVPFEMIKKTLGYDIAPTEENLKKLRAGLIPMGGKEAAAKELVDPQKLVTKGDWEALWSTIEKVTEESFRKILPDSAGGGWKYSWFCMDHVGFTGNNPRHRDCGYHRVFDRYQKLIENQNMGDVVEFHFHPVSYSGNYNDSGMNYWASDTLSDILCHKVIDRKWFPVAFRPGFHTERPDSHWFLEQWIPFDYGNQAMDSMDNETMDVEIGHYGDWRFAPKEWIPYHPDYADYQKKGNCKRWITRCLNMYCRMREISQGDIDKAFDTAESGQDVILSFCNHDYKDMVFEISRVRQMISKAVDTHPDVEFYYENANSAMRKVTGAEEEEIKLAAQIVRDKVSYLQVIAESKIFNSQPFLAIKARNGRYFWSNMDYTIPGKEWRFQFDDDSIHLDEVECIGVAVNNLSGNRKVICIDL